MSLSTSVQKPADGPIAIRPEYVAHVETKIRIKELDYSISNRTFVISNADDGAVLMKVQGKTISRKLKREFVDASGLPLFELRRNHGSRFDNAWSLALPGAEEGDDVLSVNFKVFIMHTKLEIIVRNMVPPSAEAEHARTYQDQVKLEVRGQDLQNWTTNVMCGGRRIMIVRREVDGTDEGRDAWKHAYGHRTEWEVTVAEDVDISLAVVVATILAEMRGS